MQQVIFQTVDLVFLDLPAAVQRRFFFLQIVRFRFQTLDISRYVFSFVFKLLFDSVKGIKPGFLQLLTENVDVTDHIAVIVYVIAVLILLRLVGADRIEVIEEICKVLCQFI